MLVIDTHMKLDEGRVAKTKKIQSNSGNPM